MAIPFAAQNRAKAMRETVRDKAARYLLEGRIILTTVEDRHVRARVRGEGSLYDTGWIGGQWFCSCPARGDNCAHVVALKRCTAPDLTPPPWIRPGEQDARISNGAHGHQSHDFEGRR